MTKLQRAEEWIRKYGESESGALELSCGECQAIAQELDRLRAANMGMDAEIAESERQLEQAQRENSKLRAEVAEARDSLQSCKRNHELSMRAADSAEGRLKGEIASWKNCAREWEAQDKIVRAREDRKDRLIEELRAEVSSLKAEVDACLKMAERNAEQRDAALAEVAALKGEASETVYVPDQETAARALYMAIDWNEAYERRTDAEHQAGTPVFAVTITARKVQP